VSNLAAIHAKRVTLQVKDMKFIQQIRQMMTGGQFNVIGGNM
jgi:histone H3/H4